MPASCQLTVGSTDHRLDRLTAGQWQALAVRAKYEARAFIKLCGEAAWTVRRACLKLWRTTLCDWLWQERIQLACEALARGETTKDVALMICFCRSPAHFCNQFKMRMGLSPQEYARKFQTPRSAGLRPGVIQLMPDPAGSEIGTPLPPLPPQISASL